MIRTAKRIKIQGFGDLPHSEILDILPCYVSVQDRNMRIAYANRTFVKDFGEGVGEPCFKVYKGLHERCPDCPVYKTLLDGGVHLSEETVQLSTGEVNNMIVYSAPIMDRDGRVAAAVEMSTNITRIKKHNQELTFLGQSMALMSHDIKNIVEGLQGGAWVVDEGVREGDMPLARKGWDVVKRNIADITMATGNVLYSSKKRALWRQKVFAPDMMDAALETFREKASSQGVELVREANGAVPMVFLDPSSIQRMLRNLILNAIQACKDNRTDQGQRVVVRMDFHDDDHFKYEVEDNGPGMAPEASKNIFTSFFSTKGNLGTGLGLAVVEKIVKEHNGFIEVLTSPGKGCLFRVVLPFSESRLKTGRKRR